MMFSQIAYPYGRRIMQPLDRGIVGQLSFENNIGIPLGEILIHCGDGFDQFVLLSHEASPLNDMY